jgi:hypothetical protein
MLRLGRPADQQPRCTRRSSSDGLLVICDNDSIHHARAVTAYLEDHPPPGAALRRPEPSLARQYEEERLAYPWKSRLQSDQIKMIRARRSAFLAQFPTRRVGSQTTHAPERLSRYVIIAGCGYRARSADMLGFRTLARCGGGRA